MNTRAITPEQERSVTFWRSNANLTAPNLKRFSQTNDSFIATYGGDKECSHITNNFSIPQEFVTGLPGNAMAQACIKLIKLPVYGFRYRRHYLWWKCMGLYFLESGAAFPALQCCSI